MQMLPHYPTTNAIVQHENNNKKETDHAVEIGVDTINFSNVSLETPKASMEGGLKISSGCCRKAKQGVYQRCRPLVRSYPLLKHTVIH
jgi:hypothetical protein